MRPTPEESKMFLKGLRIGIAMATAAYFFMGVAIAIMIAIS